MPYKSEILEFFKKYDGLLTGHFKLSSGNHSQNYLQCAKVLQYPQAAGRLGEIVAEPFKNSKVDAVLAPAMGGLVIGHEVARALRCRSIFSERVDGKFALRRGFEIYKEENILLVEDIITTGGSVKELFPLVEAAGGNIVSVTSIIDRSGGKANFSVPFQAPMQLEIPVYPPDDCPLCKQGVPIIKPGSRPEAK